MPKRSAGLLPFRVGADGALDVFVVHPGGPFWANRDEGAWSIAKGEYGDDEEARSAAEREFVEEVGVAGPPGPRLDLGEVEQANGKRVRVWAVEAPSFEVDQVASNEFEMEWPPKSGLVRSFPEVDRAEWMSAEAAGFRLIRAQRAFIDRLVDHLAGTETDPIPG